MARLRLDVYYPNSAARCSLVFWSLLAEVPAEARLKIRAVFIDEERPPADMTDGRNLQEIFKVAADCWADRDDPIQGDPLMAPNPTSGQRQLSAVWMRL
jgi:hypothetical protein